MVINASAYNSLLCASFPTIHRAMRFSQDYFSIICNEKGGGARPTLKRKPKRVSTKDDLTSLSP